LIEEAISGYEPITITATPYALVATDGAADQARNAVLELNVGSPLATNFAVYAPPATKLYIIKNISGYTATIYVATSIGGTTAAPGSAFVVIPTGQTSFVLCDGVNAYDALNSVSQNFRVGNNLTVSNDLTVVETATSKNITVNEKLLPPAYATAFPSSTLASALAAGASSLTLVDGTAFSSSGTIQIDSERITYSGKTTNTLTGLSRAQGGTSDVAHAAVPALNVDCSLGNYFTKSISTNSTFTISNVPSEVYSLTVQLTTSSGALPTWWANTYWPENAPPNISNGVHLFMFVTSNGGSTWRGSALINYTN